MRIFVLIGGFLLALLGGVWTYEGIAPPGGDGDIGFMLFGPIALLVGIAMLFAAFPWGESDDKSETDTSKER